MHRFVPFGALLLSLVGFAPALQATPVSRALLRGMETDEARLELRDEVLEAELWKLRPLKVPPVYQREYGSTVEVSARESAGGLSVEFRIRSPAGSRASSRGAFRVERSASDGSLVEIRIVTRDDPSCYLSIRPFGDRSIMDVYLLDPAEPVYRDVIVPAAFGELVVSSLERIVGLTESKVDWAFVMGPPARVEDQRVERLAVSIRAFLPALRDAGDGAISEEGRYVYISSLSAQPTPGGLNCSGFVKWVVDGLAYPLMGRNTSIPLAKRPLEDSRGNRLSDAMASLDPHFGLDWTRNLAALLAEARGEPRRDPEYYDVRQDSRVPYVEDLGFAVKDLEILLYTLASDHPGSMYLASVNGILDEDAAVRQHFHTLALLPYFGSNDLLRVAVFERTRESSVASLVGRYANAHIHLVRIQAEGVFAPLQVP